jgi:hypothetical protein
MFALKNVALWLCGTIRRVRFRLLLFSVPLLCFTVASGPVTEQERVLDAAARIFGPAIDSKENLFEINALYVLHVQFDSRGDLQALVVTPKYFFNQVHSEWSPPETQVYLSRLEYLRLLEQLNEIKLKGNLLKNGSSGIVTNSKSEYLDQYEHAFLSRFEYSHQKVQTLSLYFIHRVEGVVKKKGVYNFFKVPYYQVTVGERNYFVSKEDFIKLKEGSLSNFPAVGPIPGMCNSEWTCNP